MSTPTQNQFLPYGRQWLDDDDVAAVLEVLKSDWLTTGPKVSEFEEAFAESVGAKEAVAVSNGTAALHASVHALKIGPGDEVIVTTMTFAASANCVVYQGGTPIFADVDHSTLLVDLASVEAKITDRSKAIIAVDYAGQPCDWDSLKTIANRHGLALIDDACHALGGSYKGRSVGTLADLNTFSLHPVKHITSGEGGLVTTNDSELARQMRIFRNHGITTDHRERSEQGSWFYEMMDLGFNYRLTDIQCALGLSQLKKLNAWVERRQEIAKLYDTAFAEIPGITPLNLKEEVSHAYHLYVVRVDSNILGIERSELFNALRAEGIGVNVHYVPVHLHPYYRDNFASEPGQCPVAERAYQEILSLPMFPMMSNEDVQSVVDSIAKVISSVHTDS